LSSAQDRAMSVIPQIKDGRSELLQLLLQKKARIPNDQLEILENPVCLKAVVESLKNRYDPVLRPGGIALLLEKSPPEAFTEDFAKLLNGEAECSGEDLNIPWLEIALRANDAGAALIARERITGLRKKWPEMI
jgi:hypothetical protein